MNEIRVTVFRPWLSPTTVEVPRFESFIGKRIDEGWLYEALPEGIDPRFRVLTRPLAGIGQRVARDLLAVMLVEDLRDALV